jgi:L-alanine-DL-glutamate epimerase-like enolase superfamily enzyme
LLGRGECGVLSQYGQRREDLAAGFEAAREVLGGNPTRDDLARAIPNSSVRNAIDCALWDLECKRSGRSIWDLTGVARPVSIEVDLTISVNPVAKMCDDAASAAAEGYRILKLKSDGTDVLGRVSAIAARVPGAAFIVDANEAWDITTLRALAEPLARLGVVLIEQPLHHAADEDLAGYFGPVPICADESCRDAGDLDRLAGRYQAVNIKLDKTGGLTPALILARAAKARGLGVMLGCSGPTSLGAAPAYVVAALADHVDLDGPAMLLEDREGKMIYRDGRLYAFESRLWGG